MQISLFDRKRDAGPGSSMITAGNSNDKGTTNKKTFPLRPLGASRVFFPLVIRDSTRTQPVARVTRQLPVVHTVIFWIGSSIFTKYPVRQFVFHLPAQPERHPDPSDDDVHVYVAEYARGSLIEQWNVCVYGTTSD